MVLVFPSILVTGSSRRRGEDMKEGVTSSMTKCRIVKDPFEKRLHHKEKRKGNRGTRGSFSRF